MINKKRICQLVGFILLVNHRMKSKENEKIDKYLDLARELKRLWNMKVTVIPIVVGTFGTNTQRPGKETGDQRKSWDHPNHRTAEINNNTVMWYAIERGKGRSIPLPFCVWINSHYDWSKLLALYDLQPVEQRKESRSL